MALEAIPVSSAISAIAQSVWSSVGMRYGVYSHSVLQVIGRIHQRIENKEVIARFCHPTLTVVNASQHANRICPRHELPVAIQESQCRRWGRDEKREWMMLAIRKSCIDGRNLVRLVPKGQSGRPKELFGHQSESARISRESSSPGGYPFSRNERIRSAARSMLSRLLTDVADPDVALAQHAEIRSSEEG